MSILKSSSLTDFADGLQASGRYSFTRHDAASAGKRSGVAIEAALRRLKQKGRIASPRRGFYVLVPPEYREAGSPPASWFVDDLMQFLDQPYYVGLLTAAAAHGAAHQQPMAFQVITDRPTRPAYAGRVRIEFHMSRRADAVPVTKLQTETGFMRTSTPETTAFDLVRFAGQAGHLSNVCTVLGELAEKLDSLKLPKLASLYCVPDVQRLGYLLERIGREELAAGLHDWLEGRRYRPILLSHEERRGKTPPDMRWRVIPNAAVEADL